MESIGKKIIKNTLFNSVDRIWQILVLVFLTPYILHKLGVEIFAVCSLVFVVANFLGLLDFGIRTSFAKYIATYHAKKDPPAINTVINYGPSLYLGLSILILGLTLVLKRSIISLLKIPASIYSESMFAILEMELRPCSLFIGSDSNPFRIAATASILTRG
jgi:O-antigen/teichoic acid export membrane protein